MKYRTENLLYSTECSNFARRNARPDGNYSPIGICGNCSVARS